MRPPILKITTIFLSILLITNQSSFGAYDTLRPQNLCTSSPGSDIVADLISENAIDEGLSVWSINSTQFKHIAELMGLNPDIKDLILNPEVPPFEVSFTFYKDDGTPVTLEGVRVRHSTARGPAKGGIRFAKEGKIEDAKGLSFGMSVKCALSGIPLGGGKGELIIDTKDLNENEIARASKEFIWQLMELSPNAPVLGYLIDIPAPDAGTDAVIMSFMMEAFLAWKLIKGGGLEYDDTTRALSDSEVVREALAYYSDEDEMRIKPKHKIDTEDIYLDTETPIYDTLCRLTEEGYDAPERATFTDKPPTKGGSTVREEATGLGQYYAVCRIIEYYARKGVRPFVGGSGVKDIRFAIQGYGNVGRHAAIEIWENGGIIKCLSNRFGAIVGNSSNGINIEGLNQWIERKKQEAYDNVLADSPDATDKEKQNLKNKIWRADVDIREYPDIEVLEDPYALFEQDVDVYLPDAMHCQITRRIAERMPAPEEGRKRFIAEGGNAPTTFLADKILAAKGIDVWPDVAVNAGGVIDSMYEAKRNLTGRLWPPTLEKSRLKERITTTIEHIIRVSEANLLSQRDAGWVIAIKRLVDAKVAELKMQGYSGSAIMSRPYEPWVKDIYTSPDTMFEVTDIVNYGELQNFVDAEEAERTRRLVNFIKQMQDYFTENNLSDNLRRACLLGGPTAYKIKLSTYIADLLAARDGMPTLCLDVDYYDINSDDIKSLLDGDKILIEKTVDGKRETERLQLPEGGLLIVQGSLVISDEFLEHLPMERIFPAAVDVMPCMSIKTGEGSSIMVTNDDYTLLRKMLDAWFVDKRDPFEALWLAKRHMKNAYGNIYASFGNKLTIINTFDPFELLFSKSQAIKLLRAAERKAREELDASESNSGSYDVAKEISLLIQRLENILKHVPDIKQQVDLPKTAPVRQILPSAMYSAEYTLASQPSLFSKANTELAIAQSA